MHVVSSDDAILLFLLRSLPRDVDGGGVDRRGLHVLRLPRHCDHTKQALDTTPDLVVSRPKCPISIYGSVLDQHYLKRLYLGLKLGKRPRQRLFGKRITKKLLASGVGNSVSPSVMLIEYFGRRRLLAPSASRSGI